ncbi:Uncharacterised protein [Chlamydia abortus]|nr:Uncharacterised protein [Chlamydia abortus]
MTPSALTFSFLLETSFSFDFLVSMNYAIFCAEFIVQGAPRKVQYKPLSKQSQEERPRLEEGLDADSVGVRTE